MSDDEEYEFYGDDSDGEEKSFSEGEEKYDDDDGDDDQVFKSDGFRQREQAGRPDDDDLELQYRGVIEGGGNLAQIQQRHDMLYQDPLDKFKLEVQSILRSNIFEYDNADQGIIKKTINKLPFIQYKNPTAYVYSYHLYPALPPEKSKGLKERLKQLEKHTAKNSNMTMFEIIKYAYYWRDVLSTLK